MPTEHRRQQMLRPASLQRRADVRRRLAALEEAGAPEWMWLQLTGVIDRLHHFLLWRDQLIREEFAASPRDRSLGA